MPHLIILYLRSKSDRTSMTIPNSNLENQTSIGDFITVMVIDISLDLYKIKEYLEAVHMALSKVI